MKYGNSRLNCRYPKLGLKWYEFREGTTIIQLQNYARAFIQHCFFLILQALICSLTVKLYDASCPGSGKVQLKNSEKCHVHYVEHFSWKTQLNFMSTRWKGFTREMYYISWPRIENV